MIKKSKEYIDVMNVLNINEDCTCINCLNQKIAQFLVRVTVYVTSQNELMPCTDIDGHTEN